MSDCYRIEISAISPGMTEEGDAIRHINVGGGVLANSFYPSNIEVPTRTVIYPTAAQIQGIMAYIGLIQDGTATTGIETEIASLV